MRTSAHIMLVLIAAIIGGVLVFSPPLRAADPTALACPNGQTVFIEGEGPPREALLVFLRGRAVGGGVVGADGRFRLPLRAQERPGIYAVEVRQRSSRTLVASYTCFVDLPLDTTLTPTGAASVGRTATPRGAPPGGAPSATATPTRTPGGATTQTTVGVTTTVTTSGTVAVTATLSGTSSVTATSTVTRTPTPTPTITSTTQITRTVEIIDIVARDAAFPDDDEFVQIFNAGTAPVNITGWRLINLTRADEIPPYVFPAYTLGVDTTIAVNSAVGDNNLTIGDFFWNRTDVWRKGDRAQLRNAQNQVVFSFTVPEDQ